MPPFVRITLMKCELENKTISINNRLDYYTAINIKECVMENGNFLLSWGWLHCLVSDGTRQEFCDQPAKNKIDCWLTSLTSDCLIANWLHFDNNLLWDETIFVIQLWSESENRTLILCCNLIVDLEFAFENKLSKKIIAMS